MKIFYLYNEKKYINKKYILFFDLDGTLIYTDKANFLSYQEAIKIVKNIDIKLLYKSKLRFTRKILYEIIPFLKKEEYKKIIKLKNFLYNKYLNKTKINTIALKIIKKFSQTNKIILVTNSSRKRAISILNYHNLNDLFNYKFFREDYKNNKISKFKYVLDFLKINPTKVIIFENEEIEIKKAIYLKIPSKNIIDLTKGKINYEQFYNLC